MKPTARERARNIRELSLPPLHEDWQTPIETEILAAERAAAERMKERCVDAVNARRFETWIETDLRSIAAMIRDLPLEEPDGD